MNLLAMTKNKIKIIQSIFLIFLTVEQSFAQTQGSLIPNGQTVFLDNNGKPLSSGQVYFYTQGTTTPKTTYKDINQTVPNTNPIILDATGRPSSGNGIWGIGTYRQIVKDKNNNLIWDVNTVAGGSGGSGPTATGDGDAVGTIKPWGGTSPPNQYLFTYGQALNRTVYAPLFQAITSTQTVFCTSSSPIITGLSDTNSFWIGMPVELSCVPSGFTTITAKTSNSVTLAVNANSSTNTNATFFPWGDGDHSSTFNLPDYRGLIPMGNNIMGGIAGSFTNDNYFGAASASSAGAVGGQYNGGSATLVTANLPAYTPTGTITNGAITNGAITSTFTSSGQAGINGAVGGSSTFNSGGFAEQTVAGTVVSTQAATTQATSTLAMASQGGTSTPFSVISPSRTVNFIIKVTPDTAFSGTGVTSLGGMTGDIVCGAGLNCAGNTISGTNNLVVGTSVINNGSAGNVLYDNAGILGEYTVSGNSSTVATTSGALTSGHCVQIDANGNLVDSGTVGCGALPASISSIPSRQSILFSSVSASGTANFAAAGSGLNVNLTATATPLILTYAAGFNTSGALDFVGTKAADVTSFWASLPANQYSFLSIDRNASTGALTASQTLVRPQKGSIFYAPRQALLHFENNLTDDWGNTWSSSGATFTAPCAKFGSFGLSLSGSSSYAQSTSILNPGLGNWTVDVWVSLVSNVSANIFSVGNAYGVLVGTNGSGQLVLYLSSGGASWDISNGTAGATTVTAGSFHHVALTFDGSNYRLFLDGTVQVTVANPASQAISGTVWPEGVAMSVGAQSGVSSTTAGCFDEFEFLPYAKWVANFTSPTTASTVSGDWFDSNAMVMKTATGAGPTWTAIQREYVAEASTSSAAVSAVYNYSSVSNYSGGLTLNLGNGLIRSGKSVFFSAASQFITNSTIQTAPVTWILPPSIVPPDATAFYVTGNLHAPIAVNSGVSNQDCTLNARLPTGAIQNYLSIATAYSNFSGMGTATNTAAFTEGIGGVTPVKLPMMNGIAALETIISGSNCSQGGANAARILGANVIGYEMP
jgi:hypothetical protein